MKWMVPRSLIRVGKVHLRSIHILWQSVLQPQPIVVRWGELPMCRFPFPNVCTRLGFLPTSPECREHAVWYHARSNREKYVMEHENEFAIHLPVPSFQNWHVPRQGRGLYSVVKFFPFLGKLELFIINTI